jgi:two-component system, LytTR family, sensor kinase
LAGVGYDPGSVVEVLAYEGSKDFVFYGLLVALCHGALMIERDRRQRSELSRVHSELQRARLERLQEQIQPHFLFNTLNLVSSVMREDVDRADRILAELADLLRQSLNANRSQEHRLAEEMLIIEPYLSIMQQRFGPRLQVEINLDEDASSCLVPSLLLIGPVENAVKHGVARSDSPVRLQLSAEVVSQRLELRILDSAGKLVSESREGGLGLSNLRARLSALYGSAASVTLAMKDGSTELHLSLPARRLP